MALLEDLSSLMYDFELLYDFCLVAESERYADYSFSGNFWYRRGRGILREDKLRVSKISKASPLSIELLIASTSAAISATWIFIKAIEKIYNIKVNHEKKVLENERLRLENKKLQQEIDDRELERVLRKTENQRVFKAIYKRLESNSIHLEHFEIEVNNDNLRDNSKAEDTQ